MTDNTLRIATVKGRCMKCNEPRTLCLVCMYCMYCHSAEGHEKAENN